MNKKLTILAIVALLALSTAAAHAATLNVDQNDGSCNDGTGLPYCTISAAVAAAASGDTVSVAPDGVAGAYVENVVINQNLSLVSTGGRAATTIQGISFVGSLGTVQIEGTTTAVDIGGPGAGFRIEGIDNGVPAVENAAIYVRGTHSNARIRDNEIVSIGEAGLLSEFGATISGFLVDGNIFSGQTFLGPLPAGCGFGSQFSLANVPGSGYWRLSSWSSTSYRRLVIGRTVGYSTALVGEFGHFLLPPF